MKRYLALALILGAGVLVGAAVRWSTSPLNPCPSAVEAC